MDDLISRQEAIEAMKSITDSICEQQAIDALCELPSAQPDSKELSFTQKKLDTISRQAAITIPILPVEHRKYQTMNLDDAYELGWRDCQKYIEDLPSAQPETHEERTETHACDLISRQAAVECNGFREVERDDERRSN